MAIGLIVCVVSAFIATWLSSLQSFIGAPIIGLFIGILLSNLAPAAFIKASKKGAAFSAKYLLKVGIVMAGGTLSLSAIIGSGLSALPLIIFNVLLSFIIAVIFGRILKVSATTSILVGGGTAICGGTAIATLSSIVDANEDEMAYAMTAIFLFDIFAALMWPYFALLTGLSAEGYGILGGLAISDTSSVTAAGMTFDAIMGAGALTAVGGETISGGAIAIVVKLTRTVMLVFVAIGAILYKVIKDNKAPCEKTASDISFGRKVLKSFPIFILGFLVMAVLNSVIGFSSVSIGSLSLGAVLSKGYKYFITLALVGVGYKIKLTELFTKGAKPVLLGGITWLALAASTLCYIFLFV